MNDFLANHSTIIDVIYIISAVLAALFVPFELALFVKIKHISFAPLKYHLTYGHVVKGVICAIIPGLNTIAIIWIILRKFLDILQDLNDVPVFIRKTKNGS